jgi:hypothetical protein
MLGFILGVAVTVIAVVLFKPLRLWASRQIAGRDSVNEKEV